MGNWIRQNRQTVLTILVVVPLTYVMVISLLNFKEKVKPPTTVAKIANPTVRFVNSNKTITVQIADSDLERAEGLMEVKSLPYDEGMIFIFQNNVRNGFWMKDTLIPLDMIFVDEDWMIVDIIQNAQPCTQDPCPTYNPTDKYRYVIEVNGGYTKDNEIFEGTPIVFDNETD